MKEANLGYNPELFELCKQVRNLVNEKKLSECIYTIKESMAKFPHAPHPHNLMGVLLELQGDHLTAMKHFRAAWALDPTYEPSRFNLEKYGSFFEKGPFAFDEDDCPKSDSSSRYQIQYDEHGIGHVRR